MAIENVAAKPRALITGIKGFTGRYVASELLAHGWEVYGLGTQPDAVDLRYRCVDLLDAVGVNAVVSEVKPDFVIHLAAIAFVGHDNVDSFYKVNLLGTRNLLAALDSSMHRPKCILLASSANVYGNSSGGVLAEDAPLNPANDYAVSKIAMEQMARLWMSRLPIVITRPFNYTGIGQSEVFLVPKIVAHFRRHANIIQLGNIDVWRDFSDVRAVARAYRRLLEVCPAGVTVNVCSGHPHSLRELIQMLECIAGHTLEVQIDPAFVRANEVRSLSGDSAKLRGLIGDWHTPKLQTTLDWMFRGN
ncbi:nucleoside-diphosphate-sugar epimerase [Acidovorax delafieldii]|uniref:Nucleoside-diphosphate-sugar epimerase n=1 Tax=Acidovorax delafieldii TaxID=47920 RepID=A0A561XRY1_ACIDE|nr:GDP-mannose 4,6-dehydratase [Acidovorax delafieldii]TWG38860.1 nucleoside-diphosphate-sugar epimerase [Acidovorax delafieldii]